MFRKGMELPRAPRSLKKAASFTLTASMLAGLVATGVGADSSGAGVANAAGAAGAPRFQVYPAPNGLGTDAGEPSIGVNWSTGNRLHAARSTSTTPRSGNTARV